MHSCHRLCIHIWSSLEFQICHCVLYVYSTFYLMESRLALDKLHVQDFSLGSMKVIGSLAGVMNDMAL